MFLSLKDPTCPNNVQYPADTEEIAGRWMNVQEGKGRREGAGVGEELVDEKQQRQEKKRETEEEKGRRKKENII